MQALLFELKPRKGHEEHYFRHAAALRPLLAQQEGLNYIDRFRSLSRPGVILSHSLWRDEASLAKWRTNRRHHRSQAAGRDEHFEDYRLRISHVLAHASRGQEEKHWTRDGAYRAAESRTPRYLVIARCENEPGQERGESFASVTADGAYVSVVEHEDESDARATWASFANADVPTSILCMVSRDYGMFDRAEAPQYFPPIDEPPTGLESS